MANKRQRKKQQVKQAETQNYNKLLNDFNRYSKTFEENGVSIQKKYPTLSEYSKLSNTKKVRIYESIKEDTKTVKNYQGRKDINAKKALRKQGIPYVSENDKVKPATREKMKKLDFDPTNKEAREKLLKDIQKKEGIKESRKDKKKETSKSKEIVESKAKENSGIFRKYSFSKYRRQYNKLALDASRYGIQLESINPEDVAKMLATPEGINQFKKVSFTDRLSNRFTKKETVLQRVRDLGLNVKYVDDRKNPVSYEEIQKYKKLRNKYSEKRKVFNKENETLSELAQPLTLKKYLSLDNKQREEEQDKLKTVTSLRNRELKKASKDLKSETRKELVEKDLIKYNNTKGKRNKLKEIFGGMLDISKQIVKEKDLPTNEIDNKTEEDLKPRNKIFINVPELIDNKSIFTDLYTEDGSVVESDEKWNILEDETIREMFEKELEALDINPADYYREVLENEELENENSPLEVEERIKQVEERINELEGKPVIEEELEEIEETSIYSVDENASLEDLLAGLEVVEDEEDEELTEEDLERISKQRNTFRKPEFKKTSYVFDQSLDNFDNFLLKIRQMSIRENGRTPSYNGILSVFSDNLETVFSWHLDKLEAMGFENVDSQDFLQNFFNMLSLDEIEAMFPAKFDFGSNQIDSRFLFLTDDLARILKAVERKLEEVLQNATEEQVRYLATGDE